MSTNRGNFIRAYCGQELSAAEIVRSGRTIIMVTAALDGSAQGPAIIHLPPAIDFEWTDLTILDPDALGFLLAADGEETLKPDALSFRPVTDGGEETLDHGIKATVRRSWRLIPLLADTAGELDGWRVL